MRVLLTGATGYLGAAVADELMARGHQVLGVARSAQGLSSLRDRGVEPVEGDLRRPDQLAEATATADAVINAATSYDTDRGEVEAAAVAAMLQALGGTDRPFVYTSDQLIYGDTGADLATETRRLAPPPFLTWRPEVERAVLAAADTGVRSVVLRACAVYGDGGNQLFPGWIDVTRRDGYALYPGHGQVSWSFVHVRDLAVAYALAVEGAVAGSLYNVASQPPASLRDLAEAVAAGAGVPGSVRSVDVEAAAAVFGPAAGLFASVNLAISAQRIEADLGWKAARPHVLDDLATGSYAIRSA